MNPSISRSQPGVPQLARTFSLTSSHCASVYIQGVSSVAQYVAKGSHSTKPAVRSGYVAANSIAAKPVSNEPKMTARSEPAASITATRSSTWTSSGATSPGEKRSEHPKPRRSVWITRASWPSPRRNRARYGLSQLRSTCEANPCM